MTACIKERQTRTLIKSLDAELDCIVSNPGSINYCFVIFDTLFKFLHVSVSLPIKGVNSCTGTDRSVVINE